MGEAELDRAAELFGEAILPIRKQIDMLKVLLVSNIFPNSSENERGIFTYHIAKALSNRCHLQVVAPLPWVPPHFKSNRPEKYPYSRVPIVEETAGITVYHPRYVALPGPMSFVHPMFLFWPLFRLIKRLDRRMPFDVINAHWLFPDGVAAAWVGRLLKKPTVLTALGCDLNHYPNLPFRKRMICGALQNADAVTVKGGSLKEKALDLGISGHKIHIIPNGIDRRRFRVMDRGLARRRLTLSKDGPFVLTVGSLDEVKGTRFLIGALKKMVERRELVPFLLVVGDGPLKPLLEQQARDYGIADRIRFLGERPHHEVPLWMNAADVFCLPSIREGRPNVLLEAFSCGVPVVASCVGSVPKMVNERNGRLALTGSHESFKTQILACLNKEWDRNAICDSVKTSTWEQCADDYAQIYRKVMTIRT